MKKKQAELICGTLSQTTKMPGKSISLPPSSCITGGILCKKKGSVCYTCYARKGRYRTPPVINAMQRRLEGLVNPQWVEALATLVDGQKLFRFHDAGDIQGLWHLSKIAKVCLLLPNTRFWLPTKESGILDLWEQDNEAPENLCIRVSAAMLDSRPSRVQSKRWNTSTVFTKPHSAALQVAGTRVCRATKENGCGPCRLCWNHEIPNVAYRWH